MQPAAAVPRIAQADAMGPLELLAVYAEERKLSIASQRVIGDILQVSCRLARGRAAAA